MDLLLRDAELLAINKPPGVFVSPQATGLGLPNLLRDSQHQIPPDEPFHIVQRLNEDASGAVLYARTPSSAKHISTQFSTGEAFATYQALVSGYVEQTQGTIDILLFYDKRAGHLRASPRRGKPAQTHYRVVQRVAGNTWLECRCAPDRTEQLRVHLAAIGHPLTVDTQFGGSHEVRLSQYKPRYRPNRNRAERPLVDRLTLHAAAVTLNHPNSGARITIEAPLPKDLRAALIQLGRLC